MIIIDFNQIMMATMFVQTKGNPNKLDEKEFNHIAINILRSYNKMFRDQYGELVVACDGRHSWRKSVFPNYKCRRQSDPDVDWARIFACFGSLVEELQNTSPYKVIQIPHVEGDDIIGILAKNFKEPICIVARDKDFFQLQTDSDVRQYDPINKKWIGPKNPARYLDEHLLKGDTGDDVPNVRSDDDVFVNSEKRQKPVTQKFMDNLLDDDGAKLKELLEHDAAFAKNYERNRVMIDLDNIPTEHVEAVLDEYHKPIKGDLNKLRMYLTRVGSPLLVECIRDFKVNKLEQNPLASFM